MADTEQRYDVIVAGAGMAGLYLLHKLRQSGFSAVALESGDDVGGTWYWNRYPGARCDIESLDYSYSFDPELEKAWTWSERYATQPEILRYLQFVADRYDLRRDIRFSTRVEQARWDDAGRQWHVTTSGGDTLTGRHYVMATGCLSLPKVPDVPGVERFAGDLWFTNRWPHEGVDFTGQRVAVIGTGSSGIQSIPLIAEQAAQLTVFQRTPNFSAPAANGPVRPEHRAKLEADRDAYREAARQSTAGVPITPSQEPMFTLAPEEIRRRLEAGWEAADLLTLNSSFADVIVNPAANEVVQEFFREKIREKVTDPQVAEDLSPRTFPIYTKRQCLDTNYYETFNLPHVKLVNLRRTPITSITETGIDTTKESMMFDAIVFATGFDAMTGALLAVDIRGRGGRMLRDAWAAGPRTYLGIQVPDFPNLFIITGPGSPSVLTNMVVSIEHHVDFVADTIEALRADGLTTIEPEASRADDWVAYVNAVADFTLFPRCNSWYLGANVPGKPRVFMPLPGFPGYVEQVNQIVEQGYDG
ncbi:MAG: NAD(P)/FAD-dependent oxidoreductase, partial [Acidimicrobiia bacterium]|nr:NAD(P)/FAD-dependent oxidoreductase [Acidimicrobiia bacterium]